MIAFRIFLPLMVTNCTIKRGLYQGLYCVKKQRDHLYALKPFMDKDSVLLAKIFRCGFVFLLGAYFDIW